MAFSRRRAVGRSGRILLRGQTCGPFGGPSRISLQAPCIKALHWPALATALAGDPALATAPSTLNPATARSTRHWRQPCRHGRARALSTRECRQPPDTPLATALSTRPWRQPCRPGSSDSPVDTSLATTLPTRHWPQPCHPSVAQVRQVLTAGHAPEPFGHECPKPHSLTFDLLTPHAEASIRGFLDFPRRSRSTVDSAPCGANSSSAALVRARPLSALSEGGQSSSIA